MNERSPWTVQPLKPRRLIPPPRFGTRYRRNTLSSLTSRKGEGIDDADTIEVARAIVRGNLPSRHNLAEIGAQRLPTGHTGRHWGAGIKRVDGSMILQPDSWPEGR